MENRNDLYSPLADLSEAIEKRRRSAVKKAEDRATIVSTVRLVAVIALVALLFVFFFGFRIINGNGMYPALHDGDLVLTYRKASLRKGEIVFFRQDGKEYCGRIVAKAGDTVDYSADGKFYVNGTAQLSDVLFPTYAPENWSGAMIVPQGTVYVLGDYRTIAADSRDLGCIAEEDLVCKVIVVIRHKQV